MGNNQFYNDVPPLFLKKDPTRFMFQWIRTGPFHTPKCLKRNNLWKWLRKKMEKRKPYYLPEKSCIKCIFFFFLELKNAAFQVPVVGLFLENWECSRDPQNCINNIDSLGVTIVSTKAQRYCPWSLPSRVPSLSLKKLDYAASFPI